MPEDAIRVMCPNLTCRKILAVPVSARGKTVRCKGCGTNIRVPAKPVPTVPGTKPAEPAGAGAPAAPQPAKPAAPA
jgi:hypothetical protein